MHAEYFVGNGDILIIGTPDAIAEHLTSPIQTSRAVSAVNEYIKYIDTLGTVMGFIAHYETVSKVSLADVKTVQKKFKNIVPDTVSINSFTTRPTSNNYEVFMRMLHKTAGELHNDHSAVVELRNLHYSLFNDVDVFMMLSCYLNSVERWLVTAPDISDSLKPSTAIMNAVTTLSNDTTTYETPDAIRRMTDPNFTNIIASQGRRIADVLRRCFSAEYSTHYNVRNNYQNIVDIKPILQALLRIYAHWYNVAGIITSIR